MPPPANQDNYQDDDSDDDYAMFAVASDGRRLRCVCREVFVCMRYKFVVRCSTNCFAL